MTTLLPAAKDPLVEVQVVSQVIPAGLLLMLPAEAVDLVIGTLTNAVRVYVWLTLWAGTPESVTVMVNVEPPVVDVVPLITPEAELR